MLRKNLAILCLICKLHLNLYPKIGNNNRFGYIHCQLTIREEIYFGILADYWNQHRYYFVCAF